MPALAQWLCVARAHPDIEESPHSWESKLAIGGNNLNSKDRIVYILHSNSKTRKSASSFLLPTHYGCCPPLFATFQWCRSWKAIYDRATGAYFHALAI